MPFRSLALRSVILGFLTAVTSACFAWGPPFITDDPEPVDYHHWEVYVASINYHQFGAYNGTLPHIEVNYGAAPNVQVHMIAPMSYLSASGEPFQYGYGDTELGVKYRFVPENAHRPMVGVFPLVEVPTGNESRGLGVGSPAFYLPVWLQKSWGSWTTYGGGGFWHNTGPGNHDYWFSGVTAQCQTTKSLMLGFELFHTTPQTIDSAEVTGFNIGGVYDIDEVHHFMFSLGTGLKGSDHGTFYVAYQWTFGPHEKTEKSGPSTMLFGRLNHEY